ncbi:hypothetical protein [Roseovarius nanhaiticus]|uniref:Aspartate carbamoyltransferase catalytic subunit n=1 Tax=Roseovarius nanhaiticus TaxID=573024 RepID=A0A1N7F6X3_9RHOB|nr:hypothetical protein [Roseovarius nanhaiticus]SEK60459.1 hypothetical protein SAMN05216208_1333 [Roseovarius nanhaiticus]SIR96059.1 hypothetical protein SAMN05421666_0802 [Roseovarius nanhaiticus]
MSDKIEIKATETGVVRIFAVDIPADRIAAFTARNGSWPLGEALGAEALDPAHVEIFDADDLAGLGLPGYLADGYAIPEEQLAPLRGQLMSQKGVLMVVTSRAFQGTAQTLTPRAPLSLIATLQEPVDPVTFAALPDASARTPAEPPQDAEPQKKAPSDAAMSGRVATVVLLVLALLVGVMIWIAA